MQSLTQEKTRSIRIFVNEVELLMNLPAGRDICMKIRQLIWAAGCFAGTSLSVLAQSGWEVIPTGPSTAFIQHDGSVDSELEASAVEPIGNGNLVLIVHDKASELRVFDRSTGRAVGSRLASSDFPAGLQLGPKWEGLAQDSDGHYYVVGSHSGKEDSERAQRDFLLRFELMGDGSQEQPWAIKPGSVRRWHIAKSLLENLEAEQLPADRVGLRKVEGLAIREVQDGAGNATARYLAIGLREPDDLVRVFEVDITQTPEPGATLDLHRALAFSAGKSVDGLENQQLTSLERINTGPRPGYLVLTASEDKANVFHGNRLWFIADQTLAQSAGTGPLTPELIWTFEDKQKAEGIALLPATTADQVSAIVVYDNDAKKTTTPSRYQQLTIRYPAAAR